MRIAAAVLSSVLPWFIVLWISLNKQQDAERDNAVLRDRLAKCTCPAEAEK